MRVLSDILQKRYEIPRSGKASMVYHIGMGMMVLGTSVVFMTTLVILFLLAPWSDLGFDYQAPKWVQNVGSICLILSMTGGILSIFTYKPGGAKNGKR